MTGSEKSLSMAVGITCFLLLPGASFAQLGETYYVDDAIGSSSYDGRCPDAPPPGESCGPKKTIQQGIDVTTTNGDTVIVASGTYMGAGNKEIDIDENDPWIRLHCEEDGECIIDSFEPLPPPGHDDGYAFMFDGTSGSDLIKNNWELRGFVMQNGEGNTFSGIFCQHASPTIRNCVIRDGSRSDAGAVTPAVLINNPNVLKPAALVNCLIENNRGRGVVVAGAGQPEEGPAKITNCVIRGNMAHYLSSPPPIGPSGGGLLIKGALDMFVVNTLIVGNQASVGGGVALQHANVTFTNCTIVKNRAFVQDGGGMGGGMAAAGSSGSPPILADLKLRNTIVWGNDVQTLKKYGGLGSQLYLMDLASSNTDWSDFFEYDDVNGDHVYIEPGSGSTATFTNTIGAVPANDNPLFLVDAAWSDPLNTPDDWTDDVWDTGEIANYRVDDASPCVDAGSSSLVPTDIHDVDLDDDTGEPTPDLQLLPRILAAPTTGGECPIVDMGAYEVGYACTTESQCDDTEDCTDDVCLGEGACANICVPWIYGDVDASGVLNSTDLLVMLDCNGGSDCTACGPHGPYDDCDIYGGTPVCNADGNVGLGDLLAVMDALAGSPPCASCFCDVCGVTQQEAMGGEPELDGSGIITQALVIYLTTRDLQAGEPGVGARDGVNAVATWCANNLTLSEREALAAELQAPSLNFVSPVAADMVPGIVATLLR